MPAALPSDVTILKVPLITAPSSTTRQGVVTLPVTRAVLCSTTLRAACTSPSTAPLIATVFERIVASISPLSPTINVFSLAISPRKRPSMRTVSRNESLPSNSEPWSMKAVRPPACRRRRGRPSSEIVVSVATAAE